LTDSLSIVIPAYNEEQRLRATLQQVTAHMSGRSWRFLEILVIDDGSSDSTAQIAQSFQAVNPVVRVLKNPGNRGKGYSVRRGLLEARGDWTLFTDADLSAPIGEIEKLWEAASSAGALIAIGSRALDRSLIGTHQSKLRENGGRIFNLLMRTFTGLDYWDTQCGFKLFETRAAHEIFRRQRIDGFGFDAEALFIASLLGYRVVEVPVRWNHVEGTKLSLFGDTVEMMTDLARIRWNQALGRYR
jgi:dolichyl-phosphate beta-glucosyltransferase